VLLVQPPHWLPLQILGAQFWVAGGGQDAELPGQLAGRVAIAAEQLGPRQLTVVPAKPSTGQLSPPLQFSATSQMSTAARHT
jgi:hypothetical protein